MYIRLGFAQKKNVEPLIPEKRVEDTIGKAVESKWHPSWIKAAEEELEQQKYAFIALFLNLFAFSNDSSNPAPSSNVKGDSKTSKKWGTYTVGKKTGLLLVVGGSWFLVLGSWLSVGCRLSVVGCL